MSTDLHLPPSEEGGALVSLATGLLSVTACMPPAMFLHIAYHRLMVIAVAFIPRSPFYLLFHYESRETSLTRALEGLALCPSR